MKNFAEVLARAAQIGPLPLVLAAAQDEEALRALKAACEAGLAQPMLVGDEALIRPLLARVGLPSSIPIVDEPDPAQAAVLRRQHRPRQQVRASQPGAAERFAPAPAQPQRPAVARELSYAEQQQLLPMSQRWKS